MAGWRGTRFIRAIAALAGMLALGALGGCYVLHLAGGQLQLINEQQPLERAIAHEADPVRKRLLNEVPLITQFARDVLRMQPSDSYVGYYPVDRDWLTLVLSAAPKDRLEPYTRWYPIAGRVPYRSFFDEARAKRAQQELEQAGYDTILHESPAYSTLGFFRDPVTSPMLDGGLPCPEPEAATELDGCRVAGLADTLLHELTHQHLYIPGQTDFNEQLASFVGRTGAIEYLAWRGLYDESLRQRLQVAFDREHAFEQLVADAVRELEALYASDVSRETKLAQRQPIFERVSERAHAIFPSAKREHLSMNNANILQYARYDSGADTLDALWTQADRRWVRFWPLVRGHATEH